MKCSWACSMSSRGRYNDRSQIWGGGEGRIHIPLMHRACSWLCSQKMNPVHTIVLAPGAQISKHSGSCAKTFQVGKKGARTSDGFMGDKDIKQWSSQSVSHYLFQGEVNRKQEKSDTNDPGGLTLCYFKPLLYSDMLPKNQLSFQEC